MLFSYYLASNLPPEATRDRLIPETGENELIQNVSFVLGAEFAENFENSRTFRNLAEQVVSNSNVIQKLRGAME